MLWSTPKGREFKEYAILYHRTSDDLSIEEIVNKWVGEVTTTISKVTFLRKMVSTIITKEKIL